VIGHVKVANVRGIQKVTMVHVLLIKRLL